jgi:hypothetical protein
MLLGLLLDSEGGCGAFHRNTRPCIPEDSNLPTHQNLAFTAVEFQIVYSSLVNINRRKVVFCTPHWKHVVLHSVNNYLKKFCIFRRSITMQYVCTLH